MKKLLFLSVIMFSIISCSSLKKTMEPCVILNRETIEYDDEIFSEYELYSINRKDTVYKQISTYYDSFYVIGDTISTRIDRNNFKYLYK